MKDNFSGHASDYKKFRPKYPSELYEFILTKVHERDAAWDCGTGNGQVAVVLSDYFERVEATDISVQQLAQAPKRTNIAYSVNSAEESGFAENSFDLVTVAQAVHWFEFERFFPEVKRVLKPEGVIALMGYGLVQMERGWDVMEYIYEGVLGDYWDPERKYIDDEYQSIPFEFKHIKSPKFYMEYDWTLDEFIGYLNTWSAVKHYEKAKGENPIYLVKDQFQKIWGNHKRMKLKFPAILRIGINIK
ncbi:class I SAM-dependent methyltransferase [Echinicola shivajiensis]|uniref:class I SAM-dependent methyltransferase n=1 Tax=Echinicola shivajiensis TaxID=1035916 RepID=UPI001BFC29D9|nr:class I SAM-dependent methyltransferase [Echinicola shivajiensis]